MIHDSGNFQEAWARNCNPRDELFLLFNVGADTCVGSPAPSFTPLFMHCCVSISDISPEDLM